MSIDVVDCNRWFEFSICLLYLAFDYAFCIFRPLFACVELKYIDLIIFFFSGEIDIQLNASTINGCPWFFAAVGVHYAVFLKAMSFTINAFAIICALIVIQS